jgi:DNA polymerase I-like protein with 3'-5' exonuclease and polymerase domains
VNTTTSTAACGLLGDTAAPSIVGIAFSDVKGTTAYLPLTHSYDGAPAQVDLPSVFKPLLEDPSIVKVGHNLKLAHTALLANGIELKGDCSDTMLGSYLLGSTAAQSTCIWRLASRLLGRSPANTVDTAAPADDFSAGAGATTMTRSRSKNVSLAGSSSLPCAAAMDVGRASHSIGQRAEIALRLHEHLCVVLCFILACLSCC